MRSKQYLRFKCYFDDSTTHHSRNAQSVRRHGRRSHSAHYALAAVPLWPELHALPSAPSVGHLFCCHFCVHVWHAVGVAAAAAAAERRLLCIHCYSTVHVLLFDLGNVIGYHRRHENMPRMLVTHTRCAVRAHTHAARPSSSHSKLRPERRPQCGKPSQSG